MSNPHCSPRYIETAQNKIEGAKGVLDRASREVSERYQKAKEEAQARFEETVRPYREECKRREAEAAKVLLAELDEIGEAWQREAKEVDEAFMRTVREAKGEEA